MSINLQAQDCYTVKSVENKTENPDLSSKRFTFGVKQITEELVSQKYSLCEDGAPKQLRLHLLKLLQLVLTSDHS